MAGVVLAGAALWSPARLDVKVLLVLALYAVCNAGIRWAAAQEPVLDVLLVSAGFVMRPVAGAYAIPVRVSPWLFVVSLLLSLSLALLKRRAELVGLDVWRCVTVRRWAATAYRFSTS